MPIDKIKWCFKLKDGLRIVEVSDRLSASYIQEAKSSLERAQKNFDDGDLLWATVVVYYAEYYSLYVFLQKIGLKCENHFCSILTAGFLLGEEKIKAINDHKKKRVDAQYYMRVGKEQEVEEMLKEAKLFVAMFDELISNISEKEIESYREKVLVLQKAKSFGISKGLRNSKERRKIGSFSGSLLPEMNILKALKVLCFSALDLIHASINFFSISFLIAFMCNSNFNFKDFQSSYFNNCPL